MQSAFYYQFMQEGQRNTSSSDSRSKDVNFDHVFLLRRISETPAKFGICVDFSPAPRNPASDVCFSSLPIFNRDGRHYTPAFILAEDQAKFDQNSQICLASHQRKVKEFQEEKEEILLPKPSSVNRFCMVCKEPFDDYLTHTSKPSHKNLMISSPFYPDIECLCTKYGSQNSKAKGKKIRKERKIKQGNKKVTKMAIKNSQKMSESSSTTIQSQEIQKARLIMAES